MSILAILYIQSEGIIHPDVLKHHASLVDTLLILDNSSGTQIRHLIHSLSLSNVVYVPDHQDHRRVTADFITDMKCDWLLHLHEYELVLSNGVPFETIIEHLPDTYDAIALQCAKTHVLAGSPDAFAQGMSIVQRIQLLPLKGKHPWKTRIQRVRPYMYYDNGVQQTRHSAYLNDIILVDYHDSLSSLSHKHTQPNPESMETKPSSYSACIHDIRFNRELLESRSGSWPGDRACWFHSIVPYTETDQDLAIESSQIQRHVKSYFDEHHDQHGSLLRDILSSHGSLKESSIHTYGSFYDHLWKKQRESFTAIFELEIGQHEGTTGIRSSTSTLEAALRSWKEYFPQATIYGAAENSEHLFYDERIKSYQIAFDNKESFAILWSYIPEVRFDVAFIPFQRNLLETKVLLQQVMPRLKPGGYCLVENIPDECQHVFTSYQEELRYQVSHIQYISLPGHTTSVNNNLLLIVS